MFPNRRPSFFKIILPGIITKRVKIPPEFLPHISNSFPQMATMRCPLGYCWEVKMVEVEGSVYMEEGWEQFSRDHLLGDSELVLFIKYNETMCFDVQIFDRTGCNRACCDHTDCCRASVSCMKKTYTSIPSQKCARIGGEVSIKEEFQECLEIVKPVDCSGSRDLSMETASSFASQFPFFQFAMRPRYVEKVFILPVPAIFSRLHLPPMNKRMCLVNWKKKSWDMRMVFSRGRHYFSGGWRDFVQSNQLMVGDVCIFELTCKSSMRVHVFPVEREMPIIEEIPIKGRFLEMEKRVEGSGNNDLGIEAASSFTSDFPFFRLAMRPRCVERVFLLTIPSEFANKHLRAENMKMRLMNREKESWEVNVVYNNGAHQMSGGWRDFVRSNMLTVGDVCLFELTSLNSMRVRVFPVGL